MERRHRTSCLAACSFLLMLASVPIVGCSMVVSGADVKGTYRLNTKRGEITLQLSPNGDFSEMIVWPSGKRATVSGNWSWNQDVLKLNQLWIPREFAPGYIQEADALAKDAPKYTDPGNWMFQPEKNWGTVTLSVFPDNDEYFKKIK